MTYDQSEFLLGSQVEQYPAFEGCVMAPRLGVNILSEVSVRRGGTNVPITLSRKTRALMAYLLVSGKSQQREHLCEMFFDQTADPRGALRWTLSKLRPVLDDDQTTRLLAKHDTVRVDMSKIDLDLNRLRKAHSEANPSRTQLRDAAELLAQKPFVSLELPQLEEYQAWLHSEREDIRAFSQRIFQRLADRPDVPDAEALKWLRLWSRLEPVSHDAPHALWQRLVTLKHNAEAADVLTRYTELMGPDAKKWRRPSTAMDHGDTAMSERQSIGMCKANDGVKIAYAKVGTGPVLVKTANWLNHLERDWHSPIWSNTFQRLAQNHTLFRYDERGNGMSDWNVPDISFDAFLRDLETVVDDQKLGRFPLLGMSQGCAVSVAYAVRHPERVSALILIGGYASGWRIGLSQEEREKREAVLTLTRHGWGTSNPAYRQIFSQTFMPDADPDDIAWFNDFQRETTSPENAVRFQEAFGDIDVRNLLPQVKVPTLVLHARGDQRIPFEQGRELAAGIPNARFVTLESQNHIIIGNEPAWDVCMTEIDQFLADNAT